MRLAQQHLSKMFTKEGKCRFPEEAQKNDWSGLSAPLSHVPSSAHLGRAVCPREHSQDHLDSLLVPPNAGHLAAVFSFSLLLSSRSRDPWGCCNVWARCLAVGVRWAAGMNLPLSVWDIEYPLGGGQSWQVDLQSEARARSEASSPYAMESRAQRLCWEMPRTFSSAQTPLFFMKHWVIPYSNTFTNLHSFPPSASIATTFPCQCPLLGIVGKESSGCVCFCFLSKSWLWALQEKVWLFSSSTFMLCRWETGLSLPSWMQS